MTQRIFCVFAFLAVLPAAQALANAIASEQVLVSYNQLGGTSAVCAVDPATGGTSAVWSAPASGENVGDIVYSLSTSAAYVVLNPSTTQSSIIKLSGTPLTGYTASTFLSNLNSVRALAVDSAGDLYFDQKDSLSMYQQIWKANPLGQLTAVTRSPTPFGYLFEPYHMVVSPDGSSLYVTVEPENRVDVISLATGAFSNIGSGNVGFPSGITFDGKGDLLVTRHLNDTPALDDIATLSLSGTATTYDYDSTWMPFLDTGFWEGMEYGPVSGDIFVEKSWSLYAINSSLQSTLLVSGPSMAGVTVAAVPEPSTLALLGLAATGMAVCARRRKRAH